MLKNKLHIIVSSALFFIIVISYLIMALKFPLAYIVATYEDFFGEWAQVFLFMALFIISLRLSFIKSKFRPFFIILAIASCYTFLEEISWGQRIFDIKPPDFFMKYNLQRETNIHNFITGPYNTSVKHLIEYILFTGLILYGLLYPLALTMRMRFAIWIESKGILSPPLYLWPYFVLSAILELGLLSFNEAEIAEILIPLGLSIALLHYLILYNSKSSSIVDNNMLLDNFSSRKIASAICGLFLFTIVLSSGATYASYSSPRLKNKMNDKLHSGIEKFAGRYMSHDMWSTAIHLYETIDNMDPDRPSIQRSLAYCYGQIGDSEEEEDYIDKALDIDLEKLNAMPSSISTNLSLALTYKQVENFDKESYHLDTALDIALERIKNRPESISAVYWLGKAYEQRGDTNSAFIHYEKAFNLQPHKKKYRKAYVRTSNIIKGESKANDAMADIK